MENLELENIVDITEVWALNKLENNNKATLIENELKKKYLSITTIKDAYLQFGATVCVWMGKTQMSYCYVKIDNGRYNIYSSAWDDESDETAFNYNIELESFDNVVETMFKCCVQIENFLKFTKKDTNLLADSIAWSSENRTYRVCNMTGIRGALIIDRKNRDVMYESKVMVGKLKDFPNMELEIIPFENQMPNIGITFAPNTKPCTIRLLESKGKDVKVISNESYSDVNYETPPMYQIKELVWEHRDKFFHTI